MKTRNEKIQRKEFVKRAYNQNVTTVRVLWPLINKLHGGANDFLYIILKTLAANRPLASEYRIKQLVRGFLLQKKPDSWNTLPLSLNPETNWFASCRDSNLEVIGTILGYFLSTKAEHFCRILSPEWTMNKNLVDIDHIMAICDNAVFPFVVEFSISERSAMQFQKFVHVSSSTVSFITDDSAASHTLSRKIMFYEIRQEFHDWAWSCLKNGNVGTLPDIDTQ